jgi:hypothetical protein
MAMVSGSSRSSKLYNFSSKKIIDIKNFKQSVNKFQVRVDNLNYG